MKRKFCYICTLTALCILYVAQDDSSPVNVAQAIKQVGQVGHPLPSLYWKCMCLYNLDLKRYPHSSICEEKRVEFRHRLKQQPSFLQGDVEIFVLSLSMLHILHGLRWFTLEDQSLPQIWSAYC